MPPRLVYLSSGMHYGAGSHPDDGAFRYGPGRQTRLHFADRHGTIADGYGGHACSDRKGVDIGNQHVHLKVLFRRELCPKPCCTSRAAGFVAGSGSRSFWWKKYLPGTVAADESLVACQTCVQWALSMSSGAPAPPILVVVGIVDLDRPTDEHGTPPDLLRCELAAVGYREAGFRTLRGGVGYLSSARKPSMPELVPRLRSVVYRSGAPTRLRR
jgi:hypothetical protein